MTSFLGKGAVFLGSKLPAAAKKFNDELPDAVKYVRKHAGIGGMLGGIGEGVDQAFDGDFDASEMGTSTLLGAGLGLLGGGLGAGASKIPKVGGPLGFLMKGLGHGGALMGRDGKMGELGGLGTEPAAGAASPLGQALQQSGPVGQSILDFFSDDQLGSLPARPSMGLDEYMQSKSLNRLADEQIAPWKTNEALLRRDKDIDLESNTNIGQDLQNQMSYINREHASQTQAIGDSAGEVANEASEATQEVLENSGAMLAGNDSTRADLAESMAADQAQLEDRRMADSELLKRLGVSGQEALAELQGAEAIQTGQNAIKIRTSANDAITENRAQMNAKRSEIMGSLAQESMRASTQKFNDGIAMYQAKLATATARAGAAEKDMKAKAAMSGTGMKPADMYKGSNLTVMNPDSGHADQVPIFATWPREYALAQGIPPETYDFWADAATKSQEG